MATCAVPAEAASGAAVGPNSVISLSGLNYDLSTVVDDSVHRHVFLAARTLSAPYTAEIVVVDYSGHVVKTIETIGEYGLVLAPDGRTVYAEGAPITAIDTATLKVTHLAIGTGYGLSGQNPPVVVGGRLVFEADTYSPSVGYRWFIGSIELHSRHPKASYTPVPYFPEQLGGSPAAPDTVVAGGVSQTDGKEYFDVYRVSGHGKLEVQAQRNIAVYGAAVTADGWYVATAAGGLYRLSDLDLVRSFNVDGYASDIVSVAPDGEIAIAGVNDRSEQRIQLFDERRSTPVQVLDMAAVGENGINSIWALSWNRASTRLYENIVDKEVGYPNMEIGVSDVARSHCR